MELCEGGDLLTCVANQAHLEDLTCHVMHQIARAVNHMHKKGIVHRDLKPENILCCKKGSVERIKVADFGISKHMDLLQENKTFSTPVGTLTYTAPELLNGDLYGKEVDYWALGVIMHIMLSGYSPWSHCTSEIQTRRAIVDKDVELKDEDWLHVTEQLKDLILRLLHRNPAKRATNDEILRITWNMNKTQNNISWKNSRSKLRKTVRGNRARQCSTGTVEANIHLMKRVYAPHKYQKKNNEIEHKEERYLSPPPINYKYIKQSNTKSTDEDSDHFPINNINKIKIKKKKRKKSNHSSEPTFFKQQHLVKYPNHEYRRRSRDDSELCNERLKLAAKSIERYIERKNREKNNAQCQEDEDSDAFPGVKTMSYRLFDL